MTILVVDDDTAVLQSLRVFLSSTGIPTRAYSSAERLLDDDLPERGCVLTDMFMPGLSGLDLLARLQATNPTLPVILMTGRGDVGGAVRAMKGGAIDYLEKPCDGERMLEAVRRGLDVSRRLADSNAAAFAAMDRLDRLTPREHEVFEHLVVGRTTKEIARLLGNSPRTVEVHRARIAQKLQTRTLPHLVELAIAARSLSAGE